MPTIHCHRCGGFIDNPEGTTYRQSTAMTAPAIPRSALCSCDHSLVYGPAPRAESEPITLRSASRN